jgi:hypothetical protein
MFDKPTVWCYGSVIGKSKTRTQGEETMKKLGTRTYRGIILTPVLGGWTHKTSGHDATGAPFAYSAFTKSLEAARHAIKIEISSGRYEARDGILTKKGA